MLNWEGELKRFIAKKFNQIVDNEDYHITTDNIQTIEVEMELDLPTLTVSEIAHVYAFAIMKEDFEQAKKLADELSNRNLVIKIETDEIKRIGAINVYDEFEKIITAIPLKIYPDGMIVDFEKDEDFNIN